MSLKLPRLNSAWQIVDASGRPSQQFMAWWQSVVEAIEGQEAAQDAILVAIQAVQADQASQLAAITDLQAEMLLRIDEIAAAMDAADAVALREAISGSYTTGGSPLAASDDGASAKVTVLAHIRHYSDETRAPVNIAGGDISALAFSTTYYVYYDDPTTSDTSPVFIATTDPVEAQANAAAGRHPLGPIITPADGGSATSGGGGLPPGGGGGFDPNPLP